MIEVKARIVDVTKSVLSGRVKLAFEFEGNPADFNDLIGSDLRLNIKKWRNKRSNDANSYFWALLEELSVKLKKGKKELYKAYIRDVGGVSKTVCVLDEAVDELCESWEERGIGWQTDRMPSKIKGCTNVILYYGSSMFDSEQMSRLIDLVIQDCNAVGVPTATPKEIEELKQRWNDEI